MKTFLTIYGIWLILFAAMNARWVNQDNKFSHAGNGAAHIMAASYGFIHTGRWEMFFMILCIARIFFTIPLNVMRGMAWDYVTETPKAITDKIEQWLFGKNGVWPVISTIVFFFIMLASYNYHKTS